MLNFVLILPHFSRVTGNVSVRLGETAYLPCRSFPLFKILSRTGLQQDTPLKNLLKFDHPSSSISQSKSQPRAKDLADSYMVTWMRVADVTVLSVGALTFSSDPRFSVIHVPRSVDDKLFGQNLT